MYRRNFILLITNEKKYAEHLLSHNGLDDNPYKAISILSKYYYHHLGYRKTRIARALAHYLEKNYPRYRIAKQTWSSTIDKIASNAGKYPLYEIDDIGITDLELQKIDGLDNFSELSSLGGTDIRKIKQLAFTMLCIAKINIKKNPKSNGWVNTERKDLISLSKIACTQKQCSILISYLGLVGLIEFPKKIQT